MLNRIVLMGRIVHTPELKSTQSGSAVCKFSLAVDRDRKNASGVRETDFLDVVTFLKTAEFVGKYFQKGQLVYVDGRLQTRKWTDREGNSRVSYEINADSVGFGGPPPQAAQEDAAPAAPLPDPSMGRYARPAMPAQNVQEAFDELEDDNNDRVPF